MVKRKLTYCPFRAITDTGLLRGVPCGFCGPSMKAKLSSTPSNGLKKNKTFTLERSVKRKPTFYTLELMLYTLFIIISKKLFSTVD